MCGVGCAVCGVGVWGVLCVVWVCGVCYVWCGCVVCAMCGVGVWGMLYGLPSF